MAVFEVAIGLGKRWETQELISRRGITPRGTVNVPESVLTGSVFAAATPEGGKSVGAATTPDGSALVVVTRVLAGDEGATEELLMQQIEQQVTARDQQPEFGAFFAAAEASVGVARNEYLGRCHKGANRQ